MTHLGAPFLFMPATQRDAVAAIIDAVAGPDALTALIGAEGAGKTTVLDRVAAELAGRPVRVVRVSGALPGGLGLAGLVAQVAGQAGPDALPDEQRERAFEALTELDDGAERIALLVDDAHGLQPEALRYVQLACRSSPMLRVVLASLPDEGAVLRERAGRCVELPALSDDEATAFAQHLLRAEGAAAQRALPPATLGALARQGEGNPGRIGALLRRALLPGAAPAQPETMRPETVGQPAALHDALPAEPVWRPVLRATPAQSWGRAEAARPPVRRGRELRWALAGLCIGTSLAAVMAWTLAGPVPEAAPSGAPGPAAAPAEARAVRPPPAEAPTPEPPAAPVQAPPPASPPSEPGRAPRAPRLAAGTTPEARPSDTRQPEARSSDARLAEQRVAEQRCRDVVLRTQMGEEITYEDKQFLRAGCRPGR